MITIIVMLILAGVVLNLTIGERGIFKTAKESKTEYIMSEMKEELELALNDLRLEKQGNATLDDVTQDWADSNKLKEYDTIIEEGTSIDEKVAIMTKDGITGRFVIDEKLNIIEGEQITGNEQYQTIKINLDEGISIDNKRTKTVLNKPYKATVTTQGEYILETLTVTMGGQPVTVDVKTGEINIENVTGDIEITATAKKLALSITEPIIGASINTTVSVDDNSQTKGTPLYINFSATLEGQNCTITYKDDNTKTVPFEVTKNGKYVFVITGTYNGKEVKKEIEVEVNKYKSATGLVKYDAGEWKEEEIKALQNQSLYDINIGKTSGAKFTFGGFTYKDDSAHSNYINDGTIITSRNQSVDDIWGAGWGNTSWYEGWKILESKQENGKMYVTKIVHAGSPEIFAFVYESGAEGRRANYLLSNGTVEQEYNTFADGKAISPRSWEIYKDKELDEKGYIEEIHNMTQAEAESLSKDVLAVGIPYFLSTGGSSGIICVDGRGNINYATSDRYYFGIRPVVTLSSGVYISSGSGTEADPYVLAKE